MSFDSDGYALFRSVFTPDQIRQLRADADRITASPTDYPGDTQDDPRFGTTRSDLYARFPEFRWVLFHEPLLDALSTLGTTVFIPEQPLQKGFYSNWHRDTTAPRRDGQRWYLQPGFRIAQVAIYLQDNGPNGGGLDVVPRSHREVFLEGWEDRALRLAQSMPRGKTRAGQLLNLPNELTRRLRKPLSLPTKAGDVVAFDLRIRHRATRGAARDKYGLFLVCSADNAIANEYLRYTRDVRQNLAIQRHKFDDEVVSEGRKRGITLL
jgi:hypothetical protein